MLGQVWMSWEPNKLHDFDIQKNLSGKKERRKKKNIGYRVASNERRLKIGGGGFQILRMLHEALKEMLIWL